MLKLGNYYPYVFGLDFFDGTLDQHVAKVINQVHQIKKLNTIILYSYEWQPAHQLLSSIRQVMQSCNHKIIWLFNESFYSDNDKQQLLDTGAEVQFIEFDLLNLYFELTVYKSSELNQRWRPHCEKFLFLTGKPNRTNRLRLLHKFYNSGLLKQCIWSLFMDNHLRHISRCLLSELTDQEYNQFVDTHINNPDGATILYNSGGSCHYDGYPFNKVLYEQTSFRVIAETQMFSCPIISEKTWVTIANRQPFILAGYKGNLEILKNLGYRTFENYLPISNYNTLADDEARLDAVVKNTQYWLENINQAQAQIEQDVEYNYQLLQEQMNKTVNIFNSIYRKLNAPEFELFRILPIGTQRISWINFYYGVKDPQWPDCFSEKEFGSLPTEVQQECIEVHGYKPT